MAASRAIAVLVPAAGDQGTRRGASRFGALDENGQSYVPGQAGHALIGVRQWIPREHISDPVKSLVTGPLDLVFRTKA